jgi:hypothetical protein
MFSNDEDQDAVVNAATAASTGNPYLAAASIAAPIIGGLFGAHEGNREREAAERARQEALAMYAGIDIPSIEDQKLALEQYFNAGLYNPNMESVIGLGPSAFEGIALDPSLRQKQMQALEMMNEVALNGVTPADRAIQELVRRSAAAEAEAKNQQILQNMQARGMGGSGNELIARLQSSQAGADRMAQQGLEQQARSQQARMQAMEQYGNMAGQVRGQDYGEQAQLANARDAIARMNQANAQSVQQRNVANQNQAGQFNLNNQQRLADQNVAMRNQQQQYNKALQQQYFNNQMNMAGAKSNIYLNQAQNHQAQAGQTAGMWAGIGQGIGTMAGNFANKSAGTPMYDTATGQPLYDPYTGKRYGT